MKSGFRAVIIAFAVAAWAAGAAPAAAADAPLIIKAKTIYTATQGIVHDALILVEKGKIVQVAPKLNVPGKPTVIEADVVIPGLIDPDCAGDGCPGPGERIRCRQNFHRLHTMCWVIRR